VATFKLFSGLLKAAKTPDGKMTLHGVASSTTRDLHGDTMEDTALADMERDANDGLTIFLNHEYKVPEDVGGMVTHAKMWTRGVDGEGNPNYDLDFDIDINDENDRAIKAWKAIDNGHKIGLSIGAMIPEGGYIRDKKTGAMRIQHVKLLETSIVGIPANQRSWISNAIRALEDLEIRRSTTHQLGSPTITLDAGRYHIEGSLEGLQLAGVTNEDLESAPPAGPRIFEIDPEILASICGLEFGETGLLCNYETDHAEGDGHSWSGLTLAACPDCGGSAGSPKGDCENSMHKDVTPDLTDARIQVITIDTDEPAGSSDGADEPSQDAASDPADDGEFSAPTPDVTASAISLLENAPGEVDLTQLQGILDLLRETTTELVDVRRQLGESLVANASVVAEREQALAETGEIIAQAARIIQTVGNIPMGRKTQMVRSAAAEVEQLTARLQGGPYSDDFMKMLTGGSDQ